MQVEQLILFGTLGMMALILFIVSFVFLYQKKIIAGELAIQQTVIKFQDDLISATILTEQKERERIAKNLHDDIGTSLNVIKLHLQKITRNSGDNEKLKEAGDKTLNLLSSTINDLRSISKSLVPATLLKVGLTESLREFCTNINDSGFCDVSFQFNGSMHDVSPDTAAQCFRIVQELFNNLIKHAVPKQVNLMVNRDENRISMLIVHNGVGINDDTIQKLYTLNKGVGLKSIESRVHMIKGIINYKINKPNESSIEVKFTI